MCLLVLFMVFSGRARVVGQPGPAVQAQQNGGEQPASLKRKAKLYG